MNFRHRLAERGNPVCPTHPGGLVDPILEEIKFSMRTKAQRRRIRTIIVVTHNSWSPHLIPLCYPSNPSWWNTGIRSKTTLACQEFENLLSYTETKNLSTTVWSEPKYHEIAMPCTLLKSSASHTHVQTRADPALSSLSSISIVRHLDCHKIGDQHLNLGIRGHKMLVGIGIIRLGIGIIGVKQNSSRPDARNIEDL